MNWVSTRGASPPVPFIDALFAGTAPDGGLYMPERLDPLPAGTVESLRGAGAVDIDSILNAGPVPALPNRLTNEEGPG